VLIARNPNSALTPQDLAKIKQEVVTLLQKKYPNSGIILKEESK
jgi:hypothetical protein